MLQVTVTALEPGTLLTWHRDRVKFCLMEEPRLQAIFDHVVARDVVRKLMQVRGTFAVNTQIERLLYPGEQCVGGAAAECDQR